MMARPRTVSNAVARAMLRAADEQGVPHDHFLRLAGITPHELAAPKGRLAASKHQALMRLVAHVPLGTGLLDDGLQPLFPDFLNLVSVCANSPTLRQALDTFVTYRGIIGDVDTLVCQSRDDTLLFEYHVDDPLQADGRSAFANFAMLANIVRHYAPPQAVRFGCTLRGSSDRLGTAAEDFLQSRIGWAAPTNTLAVNSTVLDTPFAQHNVLLHRVFSEALADEFGSIGRPDTFVDRVEQFVREALAAGHDDLDAHLLAQLCDHLHMTRWTLRRRLQRDGCTYQDILLRVKLAEARRLLRDGSLPVSEISDQLGFTSASSFARFFRGQEGMSPVTYRRNREPRCPS